MEIHEYQAKALLADFGISIPSGGLAYSPEQAMYRAKEIGGESWVVKAQVHTGARGKAGGIKLCHSDDEVLAAAEELLGKRLVTNQTGPRGRLVYRLYVEEAIPIAREIYLGLVLDRSSEQVMVIASAAGGMDIEEVARQQPDSIIRVSVEPAVGMQDFQAREVAFALGLEVSQISQAVTAIKACYRAFRDLDATMVEVNPLVMTQDGRVLALDAKMAFDDNALFRRQNISELRDKSQEDLREMAAADRGLNYVAFDGNIGCIINGSSFRDHLERFEQDDETLAVVMIGEIGGPQEAAAAEFVRDHMSKPVLGYIAGLTAPKGRRMGHAGAIVSAVGESAAEKIEIFRDCGVSAIVRPSEIGSSVAAVLAKMA